MAQDEEKKDNHLEFRKGAGIVNGNPAPALFIQTDSTVTNKQDDKPSQNDKK